MNNHKRQIEKFMATETKSRIRRLIIYKCISVLLPAVSSLVYFINHTLAFVSILLFLTGLTFAAFALRLSLINNGAKHSKATAWWWVIMIPSFLLCGYLLIRLVSNSDKSNGVAATTRDTNTFSVVASAEIIQVGNNNRPLIWFVRVFPQSAIKYPVFVALHVHFTNLKPIATMITQYAVEGQNHDQSWTAIPSFDLRWGAVVIANAGTPKSDFKITCTTFSSALENKNIPAGETVHGWIFLDVRKQNERTKFRLRVTDATGAVSIEPIKQYGHRTKLDSVLVGGEMRIGEPIDISSIREANNDE